MPFRLPLNRGRSVFFRRRNPSLMLRYLELVTWIALRQVTLVPRNQAVIGCCNHNQLPKGKGPTGQPTIVKGNAEVFTKTCD